MNGMSSRLWSWRELKFLYASSVFAACYYLSFQLPDVWPPFVLKLVSVVLRWVEKSMSLLNSLKLTLYFSGLCTFCQSLRASGFTSASSLGSLSPKVSQPAVSYSLAQPPNSSRISAVAISTLSYSQRQTNIITSALTTASVTARASSGVFGLGFLNSSLSFPAFSTSGINNGPLPYQQLEEECVLWDSSCTGNKTAAMIGFFGGTEDILGWNECFQNETSSCSPSDLTEVQRLKAWMRTAECRALEEEFAQLNGSHTPYYCGPTCCGCGGIYASNVDVYYWPEADANTSCQSIVGNSAFPLTHGATSDASGLYWGCSMYICIFPLPMLKIKRSYKRTCFGSHVGLLSSVCSCNLIQDLIVGSK
jgi:hypothetical protein